MNSTMHFEVVRQVTRDRADGLLREAEAHRLARPARADGRSARPYLPALGRLFDRLRIVRPPAASRA